MPSRLIREGILSSDRVEKLDVHAEVFYRRLMSKVDDHGLYEARLSILRTSLYPLRVDRVREADISRWIAACEMAGLIALYAHDHAASSSREIAAREIAGLSAREKPYLQMLDTRWTARSEPKYPLPPPENSCKQLKTAVDLDGVEDGDVVDNSPSLRSGELGDSGKKRATRLPVDWELPSEWAKWAHEQRPDLDLPTVAATFRDYWLGIGGAKAVRADWQATWRNWVRREKNAQPTKRAAESFYERDQRLKRERYEAMTGETSTAKPPPTDFIDVEATEQLRIDGSES